MKLSLAKPGPNKAIKNCSQKTRAGLANAHLLLRIQAEEK